jgi:glycogen operon protein
VEGPTDDEAMRGLRKRQMKNMLATLLLSQGTPMLLAGDEFARTQWGNNNAYCQDNELSWLDWNHDERAQRLIRFVQKLTGLRHQYPILRRWRFLTGRHDELLDVKDVTWVSPTGEEMTQENWDDANTRCFGMVLDGRARSSGIPRRGEETTLLVIFNSWQDVVNFTLPRFGEGSGWTLLADTNMPDAGDESSFEAGHVYEVTARSLVLFKLI